MTTEIQDQVKELHASVAKLEQSVNALSSSVEDLVIAWNTAKGMTAFMKWLASIAAAGIIIYNIYHGTSK